MKTWTLWSCSWGVAVLQACGVVVLLSAALAELISRSSLFAASFNYLASSVAHGDMDAVQSGLRCCGAQAPTDWAAPINRSPSEPQATT